LQTTESLIKKLEKEQLDLGEKIVKLNEFIHCTRDYCNLDLDNKEALINQCNSMDNYFDCLRVRIDLLKMREKNDERALELAKFLWDNNYDPFVNDQSFYLQMSRKALEFLNSKTI
jgi:hypothetical protein